MLRYYGSLKLYHKTLPHNRYKYRDLQIEFGRIWEKNSNVDLTVTGTLGRILSLYENIAKSHFT